MEKIKVDVIFRKCKNDGEIIAMLPEEPASYGRCTCYEHIGQHSEADIMYYLNDTVVAKPEEYADLLAELTRVYDDCELVVKKRMNYNKLRKSWQY